MSTVAKIMRKNPKSVGPGTSVSSAAKHMREERIGSLFVKEGKTLVGIITDTDIVRRAVAPGKDLKKLSVKQIMSSPIATIEGTRSIQDAHDMMGDLGVRHLGVTEAGTIVGVISVRDLLLYYQKVLEPKIAQD